jgi:hypothetical protein
VMTEDTMHAQLRSRVAQVRQLSIDLAGTANKIIQTLDEVLEKGGTVNIQSQMAFITSVNARMTKDCGVIEHLQSHGAVIRRPPPVK